jgi:16S rRNA (uracil1498-N3)-methyltransferase
MHLFYTPDIAHSNELPPEEAVHALRVLRLKVGDELTLTDGMGCFYRAEIAVADNKHCLVNVLETLPQPALWKGHLHLALAPTKNMDRMEWLAEKATEIGFDELSFLECKFSERQVIKTERIEKIVVAAVKQSRKAWKPIVNPITSFSDFVKTPRSGAKYIAHCYDEIPRQDLYTLLRDTAADKCPDVTVMIGPEGDFSIDEVRLAMTHGFVPVTLGEARLRTETACLSAVMMAQLCRRTMDTKSRGLL